MIRTRILPFVVALAVGALVDFFAWGLWRPMSWPSPWILSEG